MLEKDFLEILEQELTNLADEIKKLDKNSIFDVEYSDGVLNIIMFASEQEYVINKHSASQKIWFLSPISGANYFVYNLEQKKWLDEKDRELREFLFKELKYNFEF
jgi:iron donor protein CyaY